MNPNVTGRLRSRTEPEAEGARAPPPSSDQRSLQGLRGSTRRGRSRARAAGSAGAHMAGVHHQMPSKTRVSASSRGFRAEALLPRPRHMVFQGSLAACRTGG
jgi:hypothetical protein